VMASAGSAAGSIVLYVIGYKGGEVLLQKRMSAQKFESMRRSFDRHEFWALMFPAMLPPPFPFKLFVVSAGVFRLNLLRFTIAIAVGRSFRFLLEGYLAARYGERAGELLTRYYPTIGIGLAILIIVAFVGKNLIRHAREAKRAPISDFES
jgi:membrane protein YqaA with SNARE-associated domain